MHDLYSLHFEAPRGMPGELRFLIGLSRDRVIDLDSRLHIHEVDLPVLTPAVLLYKSPLIGYTQIQELS